MSEYAELAATLQNPDRPIIHPGDTEPTGWILLLQDALAPTVARMSATAYEYNDEMQSYVRSFQARHGLEYNGGIVNDLVWDTLAWALTEGADDEYQRSELQPDAEDYRAGACEPVELPHDLEHVQPAARPVRRLPPRARDAVGG
jgi:hypothetical protein